MQEIIIAIERAEPLLSREQRLWLRLHVTTPRLITMYANLAGDVTIDGWLVTDYTGTEDVGYRIVYLPAEAAFGYEVTLDDGRELFLGTVGTFLDALQNL